MEPGEPAVDDAAADAGVDDLVAEQVERTAVQREPNEQGHGASNRSYQGNSTRVGADPSCRCQGPADANRRDLFNTFAKLLISPDKGLPALPGKSGLRKTAPEKSVMRPGGGRFVEELPDESKILRSRLIRAVSLRGRLRDPAELTARLLIRREVTHPIGEAADVKGRDAHVAFDPVQARQVEVHHGLAAGHAFQRGQAE